MLRGVSWLHTLKIWLFANFQIGPRLSFQPGLPLRNSGCSFEYGGTPSGCYTNSETEYFQQADTAMAGLTMIMKVVIIFILLQCYFISGAFTGWVKK
jgi:hypothetical protein